MFEQFGEVDLQDTELVDPGVAEDPEVVAALLLVIPPCRPESFEALQFRLDVVGLEVEVQPLLVRPRVGGALEQEPD